MVNFRILDAPDEHLLDAFLTSHRDSSMFLRANARRSGLRYRPEPFHALYIAAFRDEQLIGTAAHCWNGMLLVQAPDEIEELVSVCVKWSGRRITGLSGPLDQVRRARVALGLADAPAAIDTDEWLYGLDLSDLLIPAALLRGTVTCRAPRLEEVDELCAWRLAYDIETLGGNDSRENRERAAKALDTQIRDG